MPPPPAAPSPHRFLAKGRRNVSPTKAGRPASSLRYDVPQVDPDLVTPQRRRQPPSAPAPPPPPISATQFSKTPRFSYAARKPDQQPAPTEPQAPSFAQALRGESRREDVEDDARPYEEDEDDEMLLGTDAVPTTELDDTAAPHRETIDLPFSPDEVQQPGFKVPPGPSTLHRPAQPRFATPARQTPVPDIVASRPAFLRPTPAPGEAAEPHPEAFSPHRRGQRFLPGGMAATVQQWVVETGQAAAQSRRGQGYLRGEEWVLKVLVEDVGGEGAPWMIRGRAGDGEEVRVILTGAGGGTVEVGRCIGVRAPCWQVEIEGRMWWVGVDWREVG